MSVERETVPHVSRKILTPTDYRQLILQNPETKIESSVVLHPSLEDFVEDLTTKVINGEKAFLTIGGPPNSGKTTLLKILHAEYQEQFRIPVWIRTYEQAEVEALREVGKTPSRDTLVDPKDRTRANEIIVSQVQWSLDEIRQSQSRSILVLETPGYGSSLPHDWGKSATTEIITNKREGIHYYASYLFGSLDMHNKAATKRDEIENGVDKNEEYIENRKGYGGAGSSLVRKFAREFTYYTMKEAIEENPDLIESLIISGIPLSFIEATAKNKNKMLPNNLVDADFSINLQFSNIVRSFQKLEFPGVVHLVGHKTEFGIRESFFPEIE